jgi:hypothetical protein
LISCFDFLEGFDVRGVSLRIVAEKVIFGPLVIDISGQFGGVALSAFRISGYTSPRGRAAGIEVGTITYTAAVVLEPSSIVLWGIAGAMGLVLARMRAHHRHFPRARRLG